MEGDLDIEVPVRNGGDELEGLKNTFNLVPEGPGNVINKSGMDDLET
ncbi:MAG: hypothetical protein JXA49_03050 [Actinobacteria bacterium]|nr:hypothetical protein [Actinomycetota bacterium]